MKMYGIKNCDTIKKASKWLDNNGIDFEFHDYKKNPPNEDLISNFIKNIDLELLINKRGTTYRKLSDNKREAINNDNNLINLIIDNPSIIKRPILFTGNEYIIGFNEDEYKKLL
jgi:arsenate reductase